MRARLLPLMIVLALAAVAAAPHSSLAQSQRETTLEQMSPGMARATVVGIQEELIELGYRPGAVDGIMGPRTRAAIRAYQRTADLKVTGRASKELLDHMKFASPKAYAQQPSSDPLVAEVQRELAERGYYQTTVDGIIGPATRAAIGAYQSDAGLPVDGRISQSLLDSLRSAPESLKEPNNSLSPARQT